MSAKCDNQDLETETSTSNSTPFRTLTSSPTPTVEDMNAVTELDIINLLDYFSKNTYDAKAEGNAINVITDRCITLFEIDYNLVKINNEDGILCPQYPNQILILESEKGRNQNVSTTNNCSQSAQRTTDTIYESIELDGIDKKFVDGKYGRCRQRFPVPVILYRGRYVCRSATLSIGPEIIYRSGTDFFLKVGGEAISGFIQMLQSTIPDPSKESEKALFDQIRDEDVNILKSLNIRTIVDLMVENRKQKFIVYVTSSEKVETKENRYSSFNLLSLPYPGCEFFKDFKDNNYTAEGLMFNWNRSECDAILSVPNNSLLQHLRIDFQNYKQWDLVTITQNYMKYILKSLQEDTSGVLIHCISGWDRTPLFISMLRLCLWAEGLVHQGLNAFEILYLTISYDWLMFGHQLQERLGKGEDIFFFCFYMLKYLISDEYSIASGRNKYKKSPEKVVEGPAKSKTDIEPPLVLVSDHLGGSNISLNSISSTISGKFQELSCHTTAEESNCNLDGSPQRLDVYDTLPLGASTSPQRRRTSPITVPGSTRFNRPDSSMLASSIQSNNSVDSSGSGGWQHITVTGSLKGSDCASNCSDVPFSEASSCTAVDGEEPQDCAGHKICRAERLLLVRDIFYKTYYHSVGSNIPMGPEPSLAASIISSVVEAVFPKDSK